MLKQLTLKNFVLVEALDIDFDAGLTTITGESGAGKSILLNALGLLLGERASTETIRPGAEKADVTAAFDLSALPELSARLKEDDLEGDDPDFCLIRRVVARQGRSKAYINNVPITTQYLRALGSELVDIHGQHDHLRLADRTTQLMMLDDYAGQSSARQKVKDTHRQWQATLADIKAREAAQQAAKDKQALLSYQVEELDALGLEAGEYAQLEADQRRLAQAQSILDTLAVAQGALDELDAVRQVQHRLADVADEHATLNSARENLSAALSLLDDTAHDLRHYRDQVVVDPQALSEVEARLSTVLELARKHRVNGDGLVDLTRELQDELKAIDAADSELARLEAEAETQQQAYEKHAKALSKQRKKFAPAFCQAISQYMQELGIKGGGFDIAFESAQTEVGIDRVEFMVTTNPDFPAGPLNQIASGGEQTRIALSIQIVAAEKTQLPCMILDEADVGVGGTTADTVGRMLRTLGARSQVICITHAPQVAALGDHHLVVRKDEKQTQIESLTVDLRIDELARMLAGADVTDKSRDYAAALLADAQA